MSTESHTERESERRAGEGELRDIPELMRPAEHEKPTWLRAVYFAAGITCIVLGIVFWLVPVITGLPFYPPALVFLALASDHVRRWINKADERLPSRWRLKIRRALAKVKSERFRKMFNFPAGLEKKEREKRRLGEGVPTDTPPPGKRASAEPPPEDTGCS